MKLNIFQDATTFSSAKYMLSKIDNSNFDIDHIIVVPDKFSLLTEKLVLDTFPQGSLFNVRVKSLSSLSRELLNKLGQKGEVISSGESLLLTQVAIENVKKDFLYFKKNNISFCYEINKIISQLKSSSLSAEEIPLQGKGVSANKYHDIAIIYGEYQKLIEGSLDANERLMLLKKLLQESDVLDKTKLYFAHFDAFTSEGFSFIKILFERAMEVNVSLPFPLSIGNDYIYEKDIARKLEKIANEYGQKVEVFVSQSLLSLNQQAIARGLYSYDKTKAQNNGFYNLYGSSSSSVEVESVAKLIRFYTYKGKKYRDFQIALGDIGKYQSQIENVFARYDIPYYIDSSISADKTMLGNFVLSVLGTIVTGFGKDNLIDLLANVLIQEPRLIEICQRMEVDGKNRYKKYIEKEFVFAEEIEKLQTANTSQQFGEIIKSLCEKAEEKYDSALEKLQEKGDLKEYKINLQAREAIDEAIALIDKYSHGEIGCGEYLRKIKLLLSFKQVSTVPTYVDGVMIGDATTSGFEEKEMLIVMGAENLPQSVGDMGILSDDELKIEGLEKEIEPTIRMINRRNRFKLFNLLSLAKEKLFLFYQLSNEEGKKNELPAYIKSLNGIFSQESQNARNIFFCQKPDNEEWAMLVSGAREDEYDFSYLAREKEIVGGDRLMFGENKARVTQIESYYLCPFKHFATYGLKLKENISQFDSRDLGSVCHKMAELFVKMSVSKGKAQSENIKAFVDKFLPAVLESEGVNEKIEKLEESASLIGFLKKQCCSLLRDIVKESLHSKFKPRFSEVKFDNLRLCDKFQLIGKADRIDEHEEYLRVIDYKTGKTGNLLKQLYYGEKLQLFLYQKIVCEKFNKKEGGVFYFNAKFNYTKNDEESSFILKGLLDQDEKLIDATDSDVSLVGRSEIVQIYQDSKGLKGAALSPVEMKKLGEYAFASAEKAAQEIAQGFIEPKPTAEACAWCPYAAVCGYEKEKGVRTNKDDMEF